MAQARSKIELAQLARNFERKGRGLFPGKCSRSEGHKSPDLHGLSNSILNLWILVAMTFNVHLPYGWRPEQHSPHEALAIACDSCTSGLGDEYDEYFGDP